MFACRIASRRELDRVSNDGTFRDNMARFSGIPAQTVMTSAQMVNVLKALDADELANLQPEFVRNLIASKRLGGAYIQGCLTVASDGTGLYLHISARVGHRIRLSAASEFGSARPHVTVAAG